MHRDTLVRDAGRLLCLFLSPCLLSSVSAFADEATVDLVGRNGKFHIIENDRVIEDIPESALAVQDGKHRSYFNIPSASDASDAAAEEGAPGGDEVAGPGEVTPSAVDEKTGQPAPKRADKPKNKRETPEEKAARETDTRVLRALMQQGGAYFYDTENNPLSYEAVNALIQEGRVDEIRGTGLHLGTWSSKLAEVKKEESKKSSTQAGPTTAAFTGTSNRRSIHEVARTGKPFQETVRDNKAFDVKAYSNGTPVDGKISPLAVPQERRPFKEVLKEDPRQPFDPKRDSSPQY